MSESPAQPCEDRPWNQVFRPVSAPGHDLEGLTPLGGGYRWEFAALSASTDSLSEMNPGTREQRVWNAAAVRLSLAGWLSFK